MSGKGRTDFCLFFTSGEGQVQEQMFFIVPNLKGGSRCMCSLCCFAAQMPCNGQGKKMSPRSDYHCVQHLLGSNDGVLC